METPRFYSLDSIDSILEKKYFNYNEGYFIELGGNDGLNQSNTAYFEKFRGWRGILVAPILHNYFKCKSNRPSSRVYCNACVSFAHKSDFVELFYSDLMTSPSNLETDLDPLNQSQKGEKFLNTGEEVVKTAAIASTLDQLMRQADAPNYIDFLSIDVEGAEAEVIKGIDFDQYQFKIILSDHSLLILICTIN